MFYEILALFSRGMFRAGRGCLMDVCPMEFSTFCHSLRGKLICQPVLRRACDIYGFPTNKPNQPTNQTNHPTWPESLALASRANMNKIYNFLAATFS